MIDTKKMREKYGRCPNFGFPTPDICAACAIDALCDENDELRREVERLRKEVQDRMWDTGELGCDEEHVRTVVPTAEEVNAMHTALLNSGERIHPPEPDWPSAPLKDKPWYSVYQPEPNWLPALADEPEGCGNCGDQCPKCGADRASGTHCPPEKQPCPFDRPNHWRPAPDTTGPSDLAPAQMVEVEGRTGYCTEDGYLHDTGSCRFGPMMAKDVRWDRVTKYRPLYSDSGEVICSAEGLERWARFVATDEDGSVWQFEFRPDVATAFQEWAAGKGEPESALSTHRKPGPWIESLMEVTRR